MLNRLPCGALVLALAVGAVAFTADAETPPRDTFVGVEVRVAIHPRAAELAQRFGVSQGLAGVIYEQARLAHVEPALVFAMIAAESGFDPEAVGLHGERGLLQIKPSTARVYDARITPEMLHDPDVNLRLGLRHLKEEVEYFGDPSLGLMSYHMGRARLERAMADGVPPRDRYVQRILSSCGPGCA